MSKRTIDADADGWTRKRQATLPEASPAFVLTYLRMALRCPQRVIDSLVNSRTLGTWLLFQSTLKLLHTKPRPIQMFHTAAAPLCLFGSKSEDNISDDKLVLDLRYNPPPARNQLDFEYFEFTVWSQSRTTFLLSCTVGYTRRSLQSPSNRMEPDSITSMAERISAFLVSHT